ncbi:MAG TPA: hypothetical protein VKV95_11380 [Terriglobia bacterium]|nr:hypothetical protein [Terriglobia bacterium]
MRKHYIQLAITLCLLMAVSSALGKAQQSTTTIPRSQYSPMAAARAHGHVQQQPDTWYDFALKRFNPSNFDYGKWLEVRRRTFLEATVKNPYFPYSFSITVGFLLLMAVHFKLRIDRRRERILTEEMMVDLYNHDAYSRKAAREAIDRYNQHIEKCNRVIEAAESGHPLPGSGSAIEELNEKLNDVTTKLDAANQENDKLRAELDAKRHITTNLSTRVEALGKQGNGHANDASGAQQSSASYAELMRELNNTQQQLYAEREKNKRLKGG